MTHTLTCTADGCGIQRDAQPFESVQIKGGHTHAHCEKCREITHHLVGIPARKPVELEFDRRTSK